MLAGCATLGLWLYAGYAFERRMAAARSEAATVASQYLRAQDLLATVRSQVRLGAVRLRDIILGADPRTVEQDREQIEASYRVITMALADYEPVIGSADEGHAVARLKTAVERFHDSLLTAVGTPYPHSIRAVREVLAKEIGPRRDAALATSDEVQELNRRAFVQQQDAIAELQRVAEVQGWREVSASLVIGMGVLLVLSAYVGRLERVPRNPADTGGSPQDP